jgi:hypothetical protein
MTMKDYSDEFKADAVALREPLPNVTHPHFCVGPSGWQPFVQYVAGE